MKLTSPLGEISFFIDDNEIEYIYKALKPFESCPDINDRYIIEIDFMPDGKKHSISCVAAKVNSGVTYVENLTEVIENQNKIYDLLLKLTEECRWQR